MNLAGHDIKVRTVYTVEHAAVALRGLQTEQTFLGNQPNTFLPTTTCTL
jgi:hypothetical protein